MSYIFVIAILFALFITVQTAPLFNIQQVVTVSFMPMVVYMVIFLFCSSKNVWKQLYNKMAIRVLLLSTILLVVKYCMGQDYFKNVLQFFFIPMFISIVFEELSSQNVRRLRMIVVIFYMIECLLAIYERIFQVNVFLSMDDINNLAYYNNESWSFRSTSLMGHPLANAMVVTTILSFVLLCRQINIKYKLFLFSIGYIALFCFNARGATIIASLFIFPYVVYLIKQINSRYLKISLYTLCIVVGGIFFYLIINTSFGGRLFHQEQLLDSSARTRLDVFQFYNYLSSDQLLWGGPDLYLYLTGKLGAGGVENGLIVLIINYGLIFTMILFLMLICFHYNKLSLYRRKERIWIMVIFYLLGMMNPNLATPVQWTIWIFAYYAFRNTTYIEKYKILKGKNIFYANRNSI